MPSSQPSPQSDRKLPLRGFVLLAALTFFWGISWPFMKIALTEIRPWTFRLITMVSGGVGLLAFCRARGLRLAIPRGEFRPLVIITLLNVIGWQLCAAFGLSRLNAGRAVIIGYTMPLWATVFSRILLKEPLNPRRLLGLGLGMIGMVLLIWPDLSAIGASPFGALIMLGAAMSWGAGTVAFKYFHWTMPVLLLTAWQLALGGIPVTLGAIMIEPLSALAGISWKAVLSLLYIVSFPIYFCHWAFFSVVRLFPASLAAIGTLLIPVLGVISSGWILGEVVGWREWTALVLVVTALAVVLLRPADFRGPGAGSSASNPPE